MSDVNASEAKKLKANEFHKWPIVTSLERDALIEVLESGKWGKHIGTKVLEFEKVFSEMHSDYNCVTISNGTAALEVGLRACDIGATDEVIVPPYSFAATVSAVLMNNALPVFVDIDPETYCLDPKKIEAAITPNTKAIMPVHLGGGVAEMDAINDIAKRHNLLVIEDACQAHFAEWNGSRVGTLGDLACFSFQASKNVNCGEGGAIICKDQKLFDRCYSTHTCGRRPGGVWYEHPFLGTNARLTEFQAALLLAQITRSEEQAKKRTKNAEYLIEKLSSIDGIKVSGKYPQVTRHAYHLFIIRYDASGFGGLPRAEFIKAMQDMGIPCQCGYVPLHKEGFLEDAFASRNFRKIYSAEDKKNYFDRIDCPVTDRICQEESVWLGQNILLGTFENMDYIADSIKKIRDDA